MSSKISNDAGSDNGSSVPQKRIVIASMIGTTIEFYDFYIYATAAISVFPLLFSQRKTRGRHFWRLWLHSELPLRRGR